MTLSLFGDESADETQQRVFAVSLVGGTEPEWDRALARWTARTGGRVFHSTECETEFANHADRQKHKDNLTLYRDLVGVLVDSDLVGFSVAIDLQAHRDIFKFTIPDLGYFKCLSDLILASARMARAFNAEIAAGAHPDLSEPIRLKFTLDHRKSSKGTVGTLYQMFTSQPEWRNATELDADMAFDSRENPRIQMADLVARESMKELERKLYRPEMKVRGSRGALEAAGRFKFNEVDRAWCELWFADMEALREKFGVRVEEYEAWLADTGRVQNGRPHDNWDNRYRYLIWLDKRRG